MRGLARLPRVLSLRNDGSLYELTGHMLSATKVKICECSSKQVYELSGTHFFSALVRRSKPVTYEYASQNTFLRYTLAYPHEHPWNCPPWHTPFLPAPEARQNVLKTSNSGLITYTHSCRIYRYCYRTCCRDSRYNSRRYIFQRYQLGRRMFLHSRCRSRS
jgi:hypothetical protein